MTKVSKEPVANSTLNSFVKSFVAFIKGDDAEAAAQKVWRQAESALKTQIASMEGDRITKEDNVTSAIEKLDLARINNGKPINDRAAYIQGLVSAHNNLTMVEDEFDAFEAKMEFLQGEYQALKSL
jgi:hypothetical protein